MRGGVYILFASVDAPSDYEVAPVASFHPKLSERNKFYQCVDGVGNSQDDVELNVDPIVEESVREEEDYGFMQGAHDADPIVNLSATLMGIILTFAPPARSYSLDQYAS